MNKWWPSHLVNLIPSKTCAEWQIYSLNNKDWVSRNFGYVSAKPTMNSRRTKLNLISLDLTHLRCYFLIYEWAGLNKVRSDWMSCQVEWRNQIKFTKSALSGIFFLIHYCPTRKLRIGMPTYETRIGLRKSNICLATKLSMGSSAPV